ncbi:hypothetical protein PCANC_06089 [Puccinia coronata f. sp. avenae]|nr:hypothetical protein PCANC_06089 [Puccinia coronata f. sp. avenae]
MSDEDTEDEDTEDEGKCRRDPSRRAWKKLRRLGTSTKHPYAKKGILKDLEKILKKHLEIIQLLKEMQIYAVCWSGTIEFGFSK